MEHQLTKQQTDYAKGAADDFNKACQGLLPDAVKRSEEQGHKLKKILDNVFKR